MVLNAVSAKFTETPIPQASSSLAQVLGLTPCNTARLLAVLLLSPGEFRTCANLAAALAVSPQNVRVSACRLRRWLGEQGLRAALASRRGHGYAIASQEAALLLGRWPSLTILVAVMREQLRMHDAASQPVFAPWPNAADAFPITDFHTSVAPSRADSMRREAAI